MSKPDWEDAPEWAEYLAKDEDGVWWWFECEPEKLISIWDIVGGRFEIAECVDHDWSCSLEPRP